MSDLQNLFANQRQLIEHFENLHDLAVTPENDLRDWLGERYQITGSGKEFLRALLSLPFIKFPPESHRKEAHMIYRLFALPLENGKGYASESTIRGWISDIRL